MGKMVGILLGNYGISLYYDVWANQKDCQCSKIHMELCILYEILVFPFGREGNGRYYNCIYDLMCINTTMLMCDVLYTYCSC